MYDLLVGVVLPVSLILIMTGVGLGLTVDDFKGIFAKPKAFLIGLFCQLIILPLIAMSVISLLGLTGDLAIGFFILALCPGGVTSNVYSLLSKADVGLSISLTTVTGFITSLTIPLLGSWAIYYFAGENTVLELPLVKTWAQLLVITVIPVLLGMTIRKKWSTFAHRITPFLNKISVLILALVIIAIMVDLGDKLWGYILQAGPAALILNITTMLFGYYVGRWLVHNEAQARTICLEAGLQNGTLALLVTTTLLESTVMSIGPSIYSIFMFVTASGFTFLMLRKDALNCTA